MAVDPKASMIDLRMAAMSGDLKVVRSLLARKNAALEVDARDLLGDSGLLKAVRYGHLEIAKELLGAGAGVNVQDHRGWTCLHVAIANNRKAIFFALLGMSSGRSPTNIEAVTCRGDTPLHMAAYHCRHWAVCTLLRLGANPNAANEEGRRPGQVARHDDIRTILRDGNPATTTVVVACKDGEDRHRRQARDFPLPNHTRGGAAGVDTEYIPPLWKDQHNTSIEYSEHSRRRHREEPRGSRNGRVPPASAEEKGVSESFEEASSESGHDSSECSS